MTRITTLPQLPERPVDGHKGLFGRILIVGGSQTMIGAPVLAGTAALRMGAGLVQIAMPEGALPAALSITPELIGLGLGRSFRSDEKSRLRTAAAAADAIVIGPGMGMSSSAGKRLRSLCEFGKQCVLDADALNVLAISKTKWWKWIKTPSVLTPHPGEMRGLAAFLDAPHPEHIPDSDEGRMNLAVLAAKTFGQVMVLKGHRTVVTDGDRVYVNRTGDSSLSKAGTGDVLSGVIAALMGQGMDRFDASCAGVWVHGRAGELAGSRLGQRSVLARDVIDSLAQAVCDYNTHCAASA